MFAEDSRVVIAHTGGWHARNNGKTGTVVRYREEPDGFPWYEVLMDHDWIPWHVAEHALDALGTVTE
jgi:hypothetical protein